MRVLALFILAFLIFPISQAEAACGKFVVVKGDVQVSFAKEKKVNRARVGTEVCAGDSIKAGVDSRAKIKMVDNNELNISPDTIMKIATYDYKPEEDKKKVLLDVLKGKVRSTVKQKYDGQANTFQVKTKAAVAGVRGTDFIASYDPKVERLEVVTFEGRVEVGNMANGVLVPAVSVTAGQMTQVLMGQAPDLPKAIPASELKQMDSSSQAAAPSAASNDQAKEAPAQQDDREPASTSKDPAPQPEDPKAATPAKQESSADPKSNSSTAANPKTVNQPKSPAPTASRDTASVSPTSMYNGAVDCVTCGSQPPLISNMPTTPIVPTMPGAIPGGGVNINPDFMNQVPKGKTNLTVVIERGP